MLIAAMSLAPSGARAFGLSGAGAHLGYTNPEDLDGTVVVGGQIEFEQNDTRLHLMPNLKYWNVDERSDLNPNFDVFYHFGDQFSTTPYLGAGLGIHLRHSDPRGSDSDLGANLIGGLRFPGANQHYFMEGRYTASDISEFSLVGGITFNLH